MTTKPTKPSLREHDYIRYRDLVRATSGLEIPDVRRADLEQAVLRAQVETGAADLDALYRVLTEPRRGRAALERLIGTLTIGETYFFRNQPQFAALERYILPEVLARRRGIRRLRLWSAGSASGEEAYSLAILIHRLLPDLSQWDVRILATDINQDALEKGRRGVYGAWSFRGVPEEIKREYFLPHSRGLEVAPYLRELVTFSYLNLVADAYPSLLTNTLGIDLILCRNVFIYFHEETTRRVTEQLYDALADGGWLLVGHAEPSQTIFQRFATRNFPGAVAYQKDPTRSPGGSVSAVISPIRSPAVSPAVRDPVRRTMIPPTREESRTVAPTPAPGKQAATGDEALALWREGRPDEALPRLKARVEANPDDGRAPYLIAKIHANRLQLGAAEQWIEVALRRAPLFAPAHYLHGLILQESDRPDEALAAFRRSVYAEPQFALAHFALASLLSRLSSRERAQKALDNVITALAGHKRDEPVAEGDGMTVGQLLDLVAVQRQV